MRKLFTQEFLLVWCKVDHQQASARTQHARRLMDRACAVVEEMQHLVQNDGVERIVGEWQIVDVALPHAAVLETGALKSVARKQQHVEREVEPETALDFRAEQFEHAPRSGPQIEQGAEGLVGERSANSFFDRSVRHVQFSDAVPLGGVCAEIGLRGCGARLPYRGKPRAVARDHLVARVKPVDQGAGDIRALPVFGQPEEGPGAFPETLDEAGFGQEL